MKMATIREVKAKLSEFVELARNDVIVITRHGRAAAVLQGIDPADLEEVLYETSERFRSVITSRRQSARKGMVPLSKVVRTAARTRGR
jgi:prevent-host-death family protein